MIEENQPDPNKEIVDYDNVEVRMPKEDIFGNQVAAPKAKRHLPWLNITLAIVLILILVVWGLFYLGFDFKNPLGWLNGSATSETGTAAATEELPPALDNSQAELRKPKEEPGATASAGATTTTIDLDESASTTATTSPISATTEATTTASSSATAN